MFNKADERQFGQGNRIFTRGRFPLCQAQEYAP